PHRIQQPRRGHARGLSAHQPRRSRGRVARQRPARADLRRPAHPRRFAVPAAGGARDRIALDRQHGAFHVVVRRREVLRRQAGPLSRGRAPAPDPVQRHHDESSDPPARDVERTGISGRAIPGAQADRQCAAGAAGHVPRDGRCIGALGLPLPSALSHGGGHVPRGGGGMRTQSKMKRNAARLSVVMLGMTLALPALAQNQGDMQMPAHEHPVKTRSKPKPVPSAGKSMQGMDMSSMQGGNAPPGARSGDYSNGYTYGPLTGMDMLDDSRQGMLLLDQLEYVHSRDGGNAAVVDGRAWYGGDIDKLWLKFEGEHADGRLQDLRTEALWDHAVSTYWDTQLGVRHDFGIGPGRTWAAFGI